jgi:hypothetical protein
VTSHVGGTEAQTQTEQSWQGRNRRRSQEMDWEKGGSGKSETSRRQESSSEEWAAQRLQ